MKPLRVVNSADTFAALELMVEVLDGKVAGFISPNESFEMPAEVADEVALIVESSGSTGIPKQIKLSLEALQHSLEDELNLDSIEKKAILKALQKTAGNKTQAAKLLGVSVKTLRAKI